MEQTAQPLRQARDARGVVFEPLDAAGLAAQRNVHVVLSAPGAIRGNHYHRRGQEVAAIVGPAQVSWRAARMHPEDVAAPVETVDVPAGEAWRFTFPPGIAHAYRNSGDATMVLVAFASQPHDPADADTYRDAVIG
jgi:dTDP-4-dehydrorhamnose 3,5-epimerase-like enzyme